MALLQSKQMRVHLTSKKQFRKLNKTIIVKRNWPVKLLVLIVVVTDHGASSRLLQSFRQNSILSRSILFQQIDIEKYEKGTYHAVSPSKAMDKPYLSRTTCQPAFTGHLRRRPSHIFIGAQPSVEQVSRPGRRKRLYPYTVLGILMLVSLHNLWSRNLICYMVNFNVRKTPEVAKEFINVDLNFDQASYSVLASFGFTLLYSVFSIFAGRSVDLCSNRLLVSGATALWSASILGLGFSRTFKDVFGLRVLTGLAQAFTNPVAYSIIGQIFPRNKRASANSIYASGAYVGVGLASLTVLLSSQFGWRRTALGLGFVGMFLSVLSFSIIRDQIHSLPTKQHLVPMPTASSIHGSIGEVLSSPVVRVLLLAASLRFCVAYIITTWSAPYFREAFPAHMSQYSLLNALVVGSGGALSSTVGGLMSDRLIRRDPRARAWVCAAGCLLAMPLWAAVCMSSNFYTAMVFLFLEYLVACCWFGPSTAILQDALPLHIRGVGQGIFGLSTSFGNVAPVLMGPLLTKYQYPLKDVLLWTVPFLYLTSALLFLLIGEMQRNQTAMEKIIDFKETLWENDANIAVTEVNASPK